MSAQTKNGYAPVNGINMYYEIHGEGKPLVLIHGGGSTITTSFGTIIPMLAKYYKVIAMELQAHGHTNDRDAPESFEQDADDVAVLLNHLHITNAFIFGFSNGGNTAIQIANRHPQLVSKLILGSTFYKTEGFLPGFFEGMKEATIDAMPQALKDAFLAINLSHEKLLNMFNKDKGRMLQFKDWNDEMLTSIKVPTLIISGDKDVIVPEHAVEMSKKIPDCRLMILPAIHGAYMGAAESPEANEKIIELTVEMIKSFLDKE